MSERNDKEVFQWKCKALIGDVHCESVKRKLCQKLAQAILCPPVIVMGGLDTQGLIIFEFFNSNNIVL
ncbi:conserved hypothetical protein [Ricinus communis]|uniref:Uncharacterized protein n=1 Tax=Ricinus communis TaxID=3988 RepID=B9SI91_RICCO|nr:conserved hypothetical protein [Ricinus communis]